MDESSASWIAILTLYSESESKKIQKESEPYILSKKEATFIGRSQDCQLILKPSCSTASRYHAKVELVNQEDELVWQIHDLGTPNGTFVNNKRIKDCQRLKSGDHLTLGKPNGANFIFEWNFIEIEKLNEVFGKRHLYDETVIPNINDFENHDEKTEFFAESSDQNRKREKQVNENYINSEKSTSDIINVDKSTSDSHKNSDRKSFVKRLGRISPNFLLALIFILIVYFLISRTQETVETQKTGDEELRSYIDSISRLLLDKKLGSLSPYDPDARKARESANGQTLTTLKNLDGQTKGALLRFLHGANLIKLQSQKLSDEWLLNIYTNSNKGRFQLSNLDLNRKELVYLRKNKINNNSTPLPVFLIGQTEFNQRFNKSNKKCTHFSKLEGQDLECSLVLPFRAQSYEQTFVTPIQLSGSDLTGVVLKDAPLEGINLEGAYVSLQECKQNSSGNFFEDNFSRKLNHWLSKYTCSADFSGAGLQGARLFQSVLMDANLSNAKLDQADLRQADLRGANLTGVSLHGAILKGACYIEENWQNYFPKKGPNGRPFNPLAEGMKPISIKESNILDPLHFQECKNIPISKSDSSS
jgi:uncharacterized protein YjbI with pentapeptide repeats